MLQAIDTERNPNGYRHFFHGASKAFIAPDGKPFTASEALAAADLDFHVSKTQLGAYTPRVDSAPKFTKAQGFYVTSRDDSGDILGKVGKNFNVFQNIEAVNLASDIIDSGEANIKVMGSVKGGAETFMTLLLPGTQLKVAGLEDETVQLYLTLMNSHTGGQSVTGFIGAERVPCANMLQYDFKNAKAKFRVRHTATMRDKLNAMTGREMLGITIAYMAEWETQMTRLLEDQYSDRRVDDFLKRLLPLPEEEVVTKTYTDKDSGELVTVPMQNRGVTVALETREAIRDIYDTADNLNNIRGTGYGVLNAVNEYVQHHVEGRITKGRKGGEERILAENRFKRILSDQSLDDKALPMLLSVAR